MAKNEIHFPNLSLAETVYVVRELRKRGTTAEWRREYLEAHAESFNSNTVEEASKKPRFLDWQIEGWNNKGNWLARQLQLSCLEVAGWPSWKKQAAARDNARRAERMAQYTRKPRDEHSYWPAGLFPEDLGITVA